MSTGASLWSVRTVAIPTNQVLEIIWIVWLMSWIGASFWSDRAQKACHDTGNLDLSRCHDSRRHPARIVDRTIAGKEADLGSRPRWCVCARGRDVNGTFPDVVGTHLSRTLVVKRDHPQEGP